MSSDSLLLNESLAVVTSSAEDVTSYFYARLFIENPQLRSMFPLSMEVQRDRLLKSLIHIVQEIDNPELLMPYLQQLGRDHRKFGVQPTHYDAVGHAFIAAVREYSGDTWSQAVEDAWWRAYALAARAMIDAAEAVRAAPAWWEAEVVEHERRGDDIAILHVRPNHPYLFEPGQYCTVETAYQPRAWRSYSMANAPRPDGVLEFHVRAVGLGWVSGALVRKVAVGDVLRLGPPLGAMMLDPRSTRDVLCVGGGTGLAPMKALIEELARWNTSRRAHLFFGTRRRAELYDMPALQRMAARYPWLTVVSCVSNDLDYAGERGELPDVLRRYGDWTNHDVYVSGPAPMVRTVVGSLRDTGVPGHRVMYDSFGDI